MAAARAVLTPRPSANVGCVGFLLAAPVKLACSGWFWLIAAPAWHYYASNHEGAWSGDGERATILRSAGFGMLGICMLTRLLTTNGGVGGLMRMAAVPAYAYAWWKFGDDPKILKALGAMCFLPAAVLLLIAVEPKLARRALRLPSSSDKEIEQGFEETKESEG